MKTLSYSSMRTFAECPLKYKLNYIDRIKVPYRSNIYGAFGSAIHLCIERFYKNGKFERHNLLDLWKDSFDIEISKPQVEKKSPKETSRIFNQGYPLLQKFYNTQQDHGLLKAPIATELEFRIPCKNKNGDNVLLIGKIDIVFDTKEGFEIIDYKTTASKEQWYGNKVTLQLVLYFLAFRLLKKKYKKSKIRICLHFLRPGIKRYFDISVKDQIKALKEINQHLSDIKTSPFNATPSKDNCKYCSYTHLCVTKKVNEKGIIKGALLPFQQDDVGKYIAKRTVLNANDTGLGKTVETIYATEYLKKKDKINNVLIVTPGNLIYQWRDEIYKFTHKPDINLIDGSKRDRIILHQKDAFWNIISYDTLQKDLKLIDRKWDALVLDEATAFKNYKTGAAKAVKEIQVNRKTNYKFLLTATPIENNLFEIYNMIRFLDFTVLGSFNSFEYTYIGKRDFFNRICQYKNIQQFIRKIQPILIRHKFDDVVKDLHGHTVKSIYVDFTSEQEKAYDAIVDNLDDYLSDHIHGKKRDKIINSVALSKFTYLREVCDSTELIGGKKASAKCNKLKLMLNNILPDKVIIFSEFEAMVKILKREFGEKAMTITGRDSKKQKYDKINKFKESKNINILFATDAIKYGNNLEFAHYLINFDLPFTYAAFKQRIGREKRLGQKYKVIVLNLLTKNTCEDRIMDILKYKKKLGSIIDGVKFDTIDVPKSDGITNKTLKELIKQRG